MDIKALRGRKVTCVHLDDSQTLRLNSALVAEEGLTVGQHLPPERVEALLVADQVRRGLAIAYRLLSARPRSCAEIEVRLRRASLPPATVSQVVLRLQEQSLLDDDAFARFWREARQQGNPRGRRALLWELHRLGVSTEVAQGAVADLDEDTLAFQAAERLARRLTAADPEWFRRRLTEGLRRRGFGAQAAHSAVRKLCAR